MKNIHNTFYSNIFSLLNKGFFVENSIGEFANQKVIDIITNNTTHELVTQQENAYYIINSIGDPIIKQLLIDTYNLEVNDD